MADLLPISFPVPTESSLASYNYNDLAEGTGIVIYYLYAIKDNSATTYKISTAAPYTAEIKLGGGELDPSPGTNTYTFYTGTFNAPRTIQGTASFNFGYGLLGSVSGSTMYVQLKIYHYDGSTSKQLGSTWQSPTLTTVGTAQNQAIAGGEISIATAQTFAPGDQIKVEVITVTTETGNLAYAEVGISPNNLDGEVLQPSVSVKETTVFTLSIPFRIDR